MDMNRVLLEKDFSRGDWLGHCILEKYAERRGYEEHFAWKLEKSRKRKRVGYDMPWTGRWMTEMRLCQVSRGRASSPRTATLPNLPEKGTE